MDMSLSKLWEMVKDRESWHAAIHRVTKSRTQLSDWTTPKSMRKIYHIKYISQKKDVVTVLTKSILEQGIFLGLNKLHYK